MMRPKDGKETFCVKDEASRPQQFQERGNPSSHPCPPSNDQETSSSLLLYLTSFDTVKKVQNAANTLAYSNLGDTHDTRINMMAEIGTQELASSSHAAAADSKPTKHSPVAATAANSSLIQDLQVRQP
jgi:hypothetical protein